MPIRTIRRAQAPLTKKKIEEPKEEEWAEEEPVEETTEEEWSEESSDN